MRIRQHIGNVDIDFTDARLTGNLRECQKVLNLQVAADCDPYIPFQQGQLRNSLVYPQGVYGGELEWNAPHAHYQYTGELYLAANGSSWAKKYEKKFPTGKPLTYHPEGTERGDHWFEKAKEQHKQEWVDLVKRAAGKE